MTQVMMSGMIYQEVYPEFQVYTPCTLIFMLWHSNLHLIQRTP